MSKYENMTLADYIDSLQLEKVEIQEELETATEERDLLTQKLKDIRSRMRTKDRQIKAIKESLETDEENNFEESSETGYNGN